MTIQLSRKALAVMRGYAAGTAADVLSRSNESIEVRTADEAAAVAAVCEFSDFPVYCPNVAERVLGEVLVLPGAEEAYAPAYAAGVAVERERFSVSETLAMRFYMAENS